MIVSLVALFSSGKLYKDLFIRIIRPARDLCRIHRKTGADCKVRFLQYITVIADEVSGIFFLKVRRYDQVWYLRGFHKIRIHRIYSYGRRIPCFGENIDHISYSAHIFRNIDCPAIQPVAVLRCGCQRDTCSTGYRLLRACGDCTTRITALRLNAYGLHKIRSKGNRFRGISGNNQICCAGVWISNCYIFRIYSPFLKNIAITGKCHYGNAYFWLVFCSRRNPMGSAILLRYPENFYTSTYSNNFDLNCLRRHYLRNRHRHNNA